MSVQPVAETSIKPPLLTPVRSGFPWPLDVCPADLFDGWVVHEAALRNGLNTLLFPGQALMAYPGKEPAGGIAFAHGVSNATWLSSATVVQDKRIRRDVLEASGIPVPLGRAFSLKRGRTYARQFAESIGYPVVVKPMIGESTVEVMANLRNEAELDQAIDYLGQVPPSRPSFTTASYAFTQILTPKTSSSTRTRGTYRYLVEEHVTGQYLRLLIADGQLLSAVHAPKGPWRLEAGVRDVTENIHPDIKYFAERVWNASPGLSVLAADLVVEDYTASIKDGREPTLVEHSERPWMHVQNAANYHVIPELGQRLLQSAAAHGDLPLSVAAPAAERAATFRWEGLSRVQEDVQAAQQAASSMALNLQVNFTDPVAGVISGEVSGSVGAIALLTELATQGNVLTAPAMAAETRPL